MSDKTESWDLDDLDHLSENPTLSALVRRTVVGLSVEFFFVINGKKPRVSFNLTVNPIEDSKTHYKGVRLSMQWDAYNGYSGILEIEGLTHVGCSHSANRAFDFPVLQYYTILKWCQIIRGQGLPAPYNSDLTKFTFVSPDETGGLDGLRDFICQAFMRFYDLQIVQGHGTTDPGFEDISLMPCHPELGTEDDYWFFDIIDKNFGKSRAPNEKTTTIPFPIHRGMFGPGVTRKEVFTVGTHQYPLNYVPQVPPTRHPRPVVAAEPLQG